MENNLLNSILTAVEKRVNPLSFDTWFRPITLGGRDDATIVLQVPNETFRNWITSNYSEILEASLDELNLKHCTISFRIEEPAPAPDTPSPAAGSNGYGGYDGPRTPNGSPAYASDGLRGGSAVGAAEAYDRQARVSELAGEISPSEASSVPASLPKFMEMEPLELPLNHKYTFESFVVGNSNQFAHAAALAVAEAPGKTYNPLYIYGGVGLGKTHLMHAIGQAVKGRNRNVRLSYISSEKFMNELINAIRYDKTLNFREKYRSIDILLMDDIQFLAGKERTQEEFFHTFNALYDAQKQIVISSDCPPREIPTLEERLHSRFEWGLIADIQQPDLETKVAILKRKAEIEKIALPDNVALFIASKIKSNVRELEGSLVRLVAYASLKGRELDVDLAQEVLKNIIEEDDRTITIEVIQRTVADHYGLRPSDLKSKNNSRSVAVPRQVAMYLCKYLTKASLPEIGREFGGKHHTTVIHSVNKITDLYETSSDFHRLINSLIATLK
ncbi:MAG TPA: chromosomal replication initiator protein DnaA [Blastocatellia bacterium]|nr:chromosomal replication initiator protein DnaA [Blastocatellia bacterium]